MSSQPQQLGSSWVLDEGNISWAEDSDASESDLDAAPSRILPRTQRRQKSNLQISRSTQPEPQLIMPSIDRPSPTQSRRKIVNSSPRTASKSSKQSSAQPATTNTSTRGRRLKSEQNDTNRAAEIASACFNWVLDVLGSSLLNLKTPIAWMISGVMLYFLVTTVYNILTSSLYHAFMSPICSIPGSGYLPICAGYDSNLPRISSGDVPDPEFAAMMKVQSQFETLMADTESSASLPMDLKRSEISIRDLRSLVKYSNLPSRNELENELDGFIETVKIASNDLSLFSSHFGKGIDVVLSTNRWTKRVLDDINVQKSEQGMVPAFFSSIFSSGALSEARLLDQYIQHSQVVSGEIDKLIDEAEALMLVLHNLDERLDVMGSIAHRDRVYTQGEKDELLRDIWTYIGMNRGKKGQFDKQLRLLGTFTTYQQTALRYVSLVLVELRNMKDDLGDLRDRVNEPGIAKEGGKRVPLSVHIDSIGLGIERLEAGRERQKENQQKQARRILDRADGDGELVFLPPAERMADVDLML